MRDKAQQAEPDLTLSKVMPASERAGWMGRGGFQIGLILLLGLGLYLHTLQAPFIFDDILCITENPAIRNFGYFLDFDKVRALNIDSDIKNNFALRPVTYLTFALNYQLGGLNVSGFHLVNITIHLLNAVLVYLLAKGTLEKTAWRNASHHDDTVYKLLPLLIALLFVAHPLQTQAVTYIVQRFTSFVTFFYLLALLLYIRARQATSQREQRWAYALAFLTTLVAMKTKEIAFTLPVIMLLYDLFFLEGTLRQRLCAILPFLLTMAIIPATMVWLTKTRDVSSGEGILSQSMDLVNFARVSRWDYLTTQFAVKATYLRLLILPVGQNLDHDYRLARTFFEPRIIASFLLFLVLMASAILLAWRSFRKEGRFAERLIAFGILWFFVTLAIESSIIPIDDLLVEHRVYLPSFGFILATVVAASLAIDRGWVTQRNFLWGAFLMVALFSMATISRNFLYQDAIAMLQDVVAKSPERSRSHAGLGNAYLAEQRYAEAIAEFTLALEHNRYDSRVLCNLGAAQLMVENYQQAIAPFQRAIFVAPDNDLAHGGLGFAYLNLGRIVDAEREFKTALALNPHCAAARNSLARLCDLQGRTREAIEHYRALLRYWPDDQAAIVRLRQLTGD